MEKKSDISKRLALVLILMTVLISATSTWVLINSSISSEHEESSFNKALIHLHILPAPVKEPVQTDSNSGDIRLYIASKGG